MHQFITNPNVTGRETRWQKRRRASPHLLPPLFLLSLLLCHVGFPLPIFLSLL